MLDLPVLVVVRLREDQEHYIVPSEIKEHDTRC